MKRAIIYNDGPGICGTVFQIRWYTGHSQRLGRGVEGAKGVYHLGLGTVATNTGFPTWMVRSVPGMLIQSPLTVFIVDDSWHIRQRLLRQIEEVTDVYIVGELSGGRLALAQIEQTQPDVIILDIHLPGGNGFDLLTTIRQSQAETTIIVFTAAGYPAYAKRALSAGANYYFDKSDDFEQITGVLEKMRDQKRAAFSQYT
jgi:CheY-like chemotaxis protein